MAWEHQKSGTTIFFDIVRHILILSGTCYILSLIWEHSSVFGLLAVVPVYFIMLNLFGFLTLPLYSFTPENRAKSKMLKAMQNGEFESVKTQTATFVKEFKVNVPKESATGHDIAKTEAERSNEALDESHNVEHYQNIVFAFIDLLIATAPLIGDCSMLPHPKKTILYAIKWLMSHYSETMPEEKYDKIRPNLSYLLTVLAHDWHEIDPEDKAAIAELGKFDSFPDWALPLKLKYIDDEKASEEAFDATLEVLKDRVATISVNPSDPSFGAQNRIFTKDKADAARVSLKAMLSQINVGVDPAERKQVGGN